MRRGLRSERDEAGVVRWAHRGVLRLIEGETSGCGPPIQYRVGRHAKSPRPAQAGRGSLLNATNTQNADCYGYWYA